MRVKSIHGDNFREVLFELHVERCSRIDAEQIVDLCPWHAYIEMFEDWVFPVRDSVDLDHRHVACTRIVTGKFAEGAFGLSHPRFDLAFEDELRSPGGIETCQLSGGNAIKVAPPSSRHFIFRLVVENVAPSYGVHQSIVSDGKGDPKMRSSSL